MVNGGETWSETDSGYPLRTLSEISLRDLGPVTFPAFSDTSASLRSLAEGRSLDLDVLIAAAEDNSLRDVLFPQETEDEPGPGDTHSIVRRSWAIR